MTILSGIKKLEISLQLSTQGARHRTVQGRGVDKHAHTLPAGIQVANTALGQVSIALLKKHSSGGRREGRSYDQVLPWLKLLVRPRDQK